MTKRKQSQEDETEISRGCNRCGISMNPKTNDPYCGDCQNVADARNLLESLFEKVKLMTSFSTTEKATIMEGVSSAHMLLLDPKYNTATRRWLSIPDED